uniref:Uncharacterized protein n=1 Tax=Amphimedon queenslandica TaxID=400682 RepID=A0A1X7UUP5_AMPQE
MKMQRVVPREESDDEYSSQSLFEEEFSAEEIEIFMKCYENVYDLKHDAHYNKWKEQYEAGDIEDVLDNHVPILDPFIDISANGVTGTRATRGNSESISEDLSVKTAYQS